jgi:UDP-N-acetylglucosamine--N-acetylmuramyl-(pentapeptide) pyrophosphoryl-undecaprenol N-acetylglucosamine transferase
LFAGGGTGGHLFPAIAIAEEIRRLKPEAEIAFVGTRGKIEASVVPARGYKFHTIWISGFRRKLTAENLLFPVKVVVALVQSFFLMRALKPNVVVGTGGYVCGPVLFAASLLGIPTLLQEQNSYPGATTRMLSSRVDEVHISFETTRRYLRRSANVKLSGNPTRHEVAQIVRERGAKFFGLDSTAKTLLVFGGSLGARSINNAILSISTELVQSGVQIIWQVGADDYERIVEQVQREGRQNQVKVYRFIEQMEYAYAVCDLAVCRAGATTVAELARDGVPSILIPYPFAAADHQTENAKAMVEAGAAIMIRDDELGSKLLIAVHDLLNDVGKRKQMAARALSLSRPDAAATLAQAVLRLVRSGYVGTGKRLQIQA